MKAIINGASSYHRLFGTKKERSSTMAKNTFFIGLDIAAYDFAASIYQAPEKPIMTKESIKNNPEGFSVLVS